MIIHRVHKQYIFDFEKFPVITSLYTFRKRKHKYAAYLELCKGLLTYEYEPISWFYKGLLTYEYEPISWFYKGLLTYEYEPISWFYKGLLTFEYEP
jgi:hypothetical protein